MENRVTKLENDMVDVKVRLSVAESSIKDIKEDISSIKDDTKWLRSTITGAIITAVVGGIIGAVFLGLKLGGA